MTYARSIGCSLTLLAATVLGACNSAPSDDAVHRVSEKPAKPEQRVAEQRTLLPTGTPAASQETFATPDDAVRALVACCESKDHGDMAKIFGPAGKDFVTGDPVEDEKNFNDFADSATDHAMLEDKSPTSCILHLGKEDWAFPIPIVKTKDGKWYFDTLAGEPEILARRIGANELSAIDLCRTYVDAQREYGSQEHDGSAVHAYAQRLKSSEGKHDGLYWPEDKAKGATQSPFGPMVADAAAEGYGPISGSKKNPSAYHGYFFHILKSQGPNAPGGAYDYTINGNMIAGFALVAYPAEYGKSGIMTFIVSHDGKVYQKDLKAATGDVASKMTRFNPDSSWTAVK